MTKRLASLAVIGAAAATFALPATPASASCNWTFLDECLAQLMPARSEICHRYGTYQICV